MSYANEYGQILDDPVPNWTPRPLPEHKTIRGKYCTLTKPNAKEHSKELFDGLQPEDYTYIKSDPYKTVEDAEKDVEQKANCTDRTYFTIIDNKTSKAVGTICYLSIDPNNGSIEHGHVQFTNKMKRSFMGTEAHFLMMREAFDNLGYRRYQWRCQNLNEASKKAAQRLGFKFEGVFRSHEVLKGRNRDTMYFSIIDNEWPGIKKAMEGFLSDDNCNDGKQVKPLGTFFE